AASPRRRPHPRQHPARQPRRVRPVRVVRVLRAAVRALRHGTVVVRFLRAAAAGAAPAALLVTYAPRAGADTTTAAGVADARITLLEQPASTQVHTDVLMTVRITGDPSQLNVQATMHSDIATRSAFNDTVQHG